MELTQDNAKLSQEDLREILMSLLDSQDVQDKIRSIAAGSCGQQVLSLLQEQPSNQAADQENQENTSSEELDRLLKRESELMKECERLQAKLADQEVLANKWREHAERAENQAKEQKERAENLEEKWKEQVRGSEKLAEHYVEQNRQLKIQIGRWQAESELAREQLDRMREQLEQEQQDVKKERQNAEHWKTQMEQWKNEAEAKRLELLDIGRAAALYGELSQSSQRALENIFRSTKPELFIASGVQIDNLKQLWEFAKSEIMEGRTGETALLTELVNYFMNLYNLINGRMIYVKIEAKAGMDFDVDWHIRTSGSRPSGVIGRVYLDGYVNVNNGSIFGKSVVQVV